MKKRRVLALFLALSMALSSNGFTALAAEQDPVVAIEADLSEGTDDTDGESVASDANDENESNASESENGAQDNTGENGNASEGGSDVSEDGNTSDGNGGTEGGNSSENGDGTGENESGENGENVDGTSDGSGETEDNISEDGSENDNDAEVGNDADDTEAGDSETLEEELEAEKAIDSVEVYEPLMRTFTDETGMVVTYDANAAEHYEYDVDDNGVLISVTIPTLPDSPIEHISGTVELKQRADKPYNTIGADIFGEDKDKIEYVILPSGVGITKIGENAFTGYKKLRGITLPVDLRQIGTSAFENCTNLMQLSIPNKVESIGDSAFSGDTSLFMVYIRDYSYSKMKSIGNLAFYNCQRLEKFGSDADFVLPGYLEVIGSSAFENCRAIKKLTLPDTVKEITTKDPVTGVETTSVALGNSAFKDCKALMELNLSGVANIPNEAFRGCNNLLSVKFSNGNTNIGEYAFAECYGLAELNLVRTITNIGNYAFSKCKNLRYVKFGNSDVTLGKKEAFPNDNEFPLWIRGEENSKVHEYAVDHTNMRFIINDGTTNEYFKYTYDCLGYKDNVDLKFACADQTDPNEKNNKKGVKSGVEIIVSIVRPSSVSYIEGSLKCNGTVIKKNKDGEYSFKMPVGGAYVTAEFERTKNDSEVIGNADSLTYQLSNGEMLKAGEYMLKVGQSSRMFIIDMGDDNSIVDFSRIKFETSDSKIATVSKDGTIKAIKKGTAYITAIITLDAKNNKRTSKGVTIQVEDAEVDSLKLKPMSYDTNIMKTEVNVLNEITGFYLKKSSVESSGTTFVLMATAYDEFDDNISVDLKWSTSDSKVAKLAKTSTKSSEPQNTITIPKGASGAATITATATVGSGSNQSKKYCKFTVCVQDMAPRLSASTITLNPYQTYGTALDIISASAYGVEIDKSSIELRRNEDKALASKYFRLVEDETDDGNDSIAKFRLESLNPDIQDGTYQEIVYVEVNDNYEYLPLTVKVKRSIPNPKVTFDKKKEKINLFYADGKIGVEPVISNLGNVVIEDFELENLSTGADDSKFDQNFEIVDETDTSCVIQRSENNMQYTSKKKPVVTGYLVLKFKDYRDGVNTKKYKITVPTNTVKPSYKLERTSNTFNVTSGEQTVSIALIDKKTKTAVDLNDGEWEIKKAASSTSTAVRQNSVSVDENGKISIDVNPKGTSGKVILSIHNKEWAEEQYLKYQYNVKISNKKPTFKLSKSSVTLNKYFEDSEARFTITPNQYGITVTGLSNDDFIRPSKLSAAKEEQYSKIKFDWDDDKKEVIVKLTDSEIKNGSYKFICYPIGEEGGKVTITVKVTGVSPSVSLKGSASLNLNADTADTAELTLNIKNLPDGGIMDDEDTARSITCATKKEDDDDAADYFKFEIENKIENKKEVKKLKINLDQPDEVTAKTYTFSMTPSYEGYDIGERTPKTVKFKVKVYRKSISVSLKAKGRINLLQRFDEDDFDKSDNSYTKAESYNVAESMWVAANTTEPSFDEMGDGGDVTTPGGGTSGTEGGSEEVETPPETPTTYNITLTKPVEVDKLEYALYDDSGDDFNIETITYADYESPIATDGTKKLAVKVTPTDGYRIDSVKATMAAAEAGQQPIELESDDGSIYILDQMISADTTISIEVIYENGKEVTFEVNGKHTKVKRSSDDEDVISGEDAEITTADGYTFFIEKKAGYDAKVEVYTVAENQSTQLLTEGITHTSVDSRNEKYVITADKITGDIIIIVTDICKVTINNNDANEIITNLEAEIEGGNSVDNIEGTHSLDVEYEDTVSLGFDVDTTKLVGKSIVVKAVDIDSNSEVELTPDIKGSHYTYTTGKITDNTKIAISIVIKKTVTLPKDLPQGVDKLKYAIVNNIAELTSTSEFIEYTDNNNIQLNDGQILAVKVTPKDNYAVESVTASTNAGEGGEVSGNTITFDKASVDDVYYTTQIIPDNAVISVTVNEIYSVNFVQKGSHFTIKDNAGGAISNNKDSVVKGSNYTFIVESDDSCGLKVEAYTTDSYNKPSPESVKVEGPADDQNTYTIDNGDINGDITIVVTDVYTITLDDKTAGGVTGLSYKAGNATDDILYESDKKIEVAYGESLSFKFTKTGEALIVVFDEEGNKLSESSESTGNSKVYTIASDKITGNETITIAVAYEITEAIDKDAGLDMASITYVYNGNVITDGSSHLVIAKKELAFTVEAEDGYVLKEVKYAVGASSEEADYKTLTANDNVYTIDAMDIKGNLTIKVTAEIKDKVNYTVKFDCDGATVNINSKDGITVSSESVTISRAEGAERSFTFTVTPNTGNKLRYVGTNKDLETPSSDISNTEGVYTFTLPENPRAVTTIYIKADVPKTDLKVLFRALIGDTAYEPPVYMVSTVTFTNVDKTQITTKPILSTGYANETYAEDGEVNFVIPAIPEGYTLNNVKVGGELVPSKIFTVTEGTETETKEVTIYTLSLKDIAKDVTVDISLTSNSQADEPQSKYNLKNSIVYTPIVSNLKDTVVNANIYDVINGVEPDYEDPTSRFFNIEVINGLLYVTPKQDFNTYGDDDELGEWDYLKNNTTYTVRIWLEFDKYKSGIEEDGNGVWVAKPIKIKTAQVLPKVVTDTNTLNLYQSNPDYKATFYVSLKDPKNSVGEIEGIEFGDKDEKARDSFNWDVREIQEKDGALKVTISLNGSSLYASNSTNKVKMYVKFKNQARKTTGTAITMNIKVNK